MKGVPYAGASAGQRARDEITKVLRRFGCESIDEADAPKVVALPGRGPAST
jgi:hypothetical protein